MSITTYPQFHTALCLAGSYIDGMLKGKTPSVEGMVVFETIIGQCTDYVIVQRASELVRPTAQIIALNARRSKRQFCKGDAR